jgi:sulfhydrogenase subunit gamma (sulfur reductase)
MENIYLPELASIIEMIPETPNIQTLAISLQDQRPLGARPGQFLELTIFGYGEFPVSIAGIQGTGKNQFLITVQRKGRVTKELVNLQREATIGIRGPFGNGFPLQEMIGKDILLVTGGIGLAPVRFLIDHLLKNKNQYGSLKLLHGARTPSDLIYKNTFIFDQEKTKQSGLETFITVDEPDGNWKGYVGVVPELLSETEIVPAKTIAILCGPSIMMKSASLRLIEIGLSGDQIFLSMERRMQCGKGMCGHCMVGHKRVCIDGPVLSYESIKGVLDRIF